MNDVEVKIRVIPKENNNNSDETNETLKNQTLDALSKSFYKDYTMEKLEKVTTLSEDNLSKLPELFERFKVDNKHGYKNKYKRRRR